MKTWVILAKKHHIAIACLLLATAAAHSGEITFDGTTPALESSPYANSLRPPTDANNYTVIIDYSGGSTDPAYAYGAYSPRGTASGTVLVKNGTITQNVSGGYSLYGSVAGNTATLTGGSVGQEAFGGSIYNGGGDASGNRLFISGTASITSKATGGSAKDGNAFDNLVEMTGGAASSLVGGHSTKGNATNNEVRFTGGTVKNSVYGGSVSNLGSGNVENNRVILENISLKSASGGFNNGSGNATGNSVTVTNSVVSNLDGGEAVNGDASYNSVDFYSGTIGYNAMGEISGGQSQLGSVHDNIVTVHAGATDSTNGATIAGGQCNGSGTGDVFNNTVIIHSLTSPTMAAIYGGQVTRSGSGVVYGNTVNFYNGNLLGIASGIFGGYHGGTAGGDAHDNVVNFYNGSSSVVGGGYSANGEASDNQVNIFGGSVTNNVYGGMAPGGATNNNTVLLSGAPTLTDAGIHGGSGTSSSGNILKLHGYAGSAVKSVDGFQAYDFLVSTSLAGGGPALQATDTVVMSANSSVTINFLPEGPRLHENDRITLLSGGTLTPGAYNQAATARQGIVLVYDLDLANSTNDLYATVRSTHLNPETKSLSAGRAAALAHLNQGADLIADSGYDAANAFLGSTGNGWSGPVAFGAVGGGHFRHKTGSHVDVDGVSLLFGMAWRNNGPCGALLLGTFLETGYADYDTHNAFPSGRVRGDGDSRYYGGGLMARYEWKNGAYVEASGRIGGSRNRFDSDLFDFAGSRAKYDINSAYYGVHAGIGYLWRISEKASLDVSAKYFWTRQAKDSAIVTSDRVNFRADDSHRLRLGGKLHFATANRCIVPYVGAAFEYEFDGKVRADSYGYNFGVPKLRGGTGVGEIGVAMRRNRVFADLGIQGSVGRREGVSGTVRIGWSF